MKLTDVISKESRIEEGNPKFFIAEKNFFINGFPILKDSLVSYDGKSKIEVNLHLLGHLQAINVPKYISQTLPEDESHNVLVTKSSSCAKEMEKLPLSGWGLWHKDHFDEWTRKFSDYGERISENPLEYSGITFSSIMYAFNAVTNSLEYFINLKPIELKIKDLFIPLPPFLEISKGSSDYTIIPLDTMEYFGVKLRGVCGLDSNGIISGETVEEIKTQELVSGVPWIIPKLFQVEILNNGQIRVGAFNEKNHKVERHILKSLA